MLIIKPSSLGDIVHTLPAVALLKQMWPQLSVRWIANTEWAPLLEGNPLLTEVIPFPRSEFRGLVRGFRALRWLSNLRHLVPHVALDFQGLFRSALMARASRARFVAGLSDAREAAVFFYSRTIAVDAGAHAIDRYLTLVRALGAEGKTPLTANLLPAGEQPNVALPGSFIVLHPFARGEGKSLTVAQILTLARLLSPHAVVVAGVCAHHSRIEWPENVVDLTNRTTLLELVWVMRHASFVVSVDSGPMHLADALDRPLLAIHTWSDPRKVGPYSEAAWVWKGGKMTRRREIDDALARRKNLPDDEDLAAIAAHVGAHAASSQVDSS